MKRYICSYSYLFCVCGYFNSYNEEKEFWIPNISIENTKNISLDIFVLIPKIQGLEMLGNYRPISLCNAIYKIVTKIVVARLRSYLDKLISPLQRALVLGRKGIDNAIIMQEIIHTLSKKSGGGGGVCGIKNWFAEGMW